MIQFLISGLTEVFGIFVAGLTLVAKPSIEKLTELYSQDWYAQYRSRRKE